MKKARKTFTEEVQAQANGVRVRDGDRKKSFPGPGTYVKEKYGHAACAKDKLMGSYK
jgi:hypothetical protein